MEKKKEKKEQEWTKQGSYMGRSGNFSDYQKMLDEAAKAPVKVEAPKDLKPEPPPNIVRKIIRKATGK